MRELVKKYQNLSIEAKAAIWFVVCNFINKGISMIIVPIYTRVLPTEEYGRYTVFQSWLNLLIIIATLEISRGHYKVGIVKYESDVKRYSSSMLGLGSAVTAVLFTVYLAAIPQFNQLLGMSTATMIAMFAYLFVYPAWEFWAIHQRFEYKYKKMVIATLAVAILSPVVGVVGITVLKLEGDAAIYSKLLIQGFAALFLYIQFMLRGHTFFDKAYWREVFVFNITFVPYMLSTVVLNQADRIMINNMIGTAEAAIYSVAYSVAVLFQLFNTAISDALVPWLYRKLKDQSYKEIEPVNDKLLVLVAVLNLTLVLFAPEVIKLFAPSQYYEAIWIIPPVTASVFFVFLFTRYINVEIYYGATSKISGVSICVALLNVVLNYICIKQWGYLAAGYTTLICYMVFCIVHFLSLKKVCKANCDGIQIFTVKKTALIGAVFLMLTFTTMALYDHSIIRYLFAIAIVIYCYKHRDFLTWIIKSKQSD